MRDVIGAVDVEQIGVGVIDLRKLQVVIIQQLFHQADHRQRGDFLPNPELSGDLIVQMFADAGNSFARRPIGGQTLRSGDLRIDQAQTFEAVRLQGSLKGFGDFFGAINFVQIELVIAVVGMGFEQLIDDEQREGSHQAQGKKIDCVFNFHSASHPEPDAAIIPPCRLRRLNYAGALRWRFFSIKC